MHASYRRCSLFRLWCPGNQSYRRVSQDLTFDGLSGVVLLGGALTPLEQYHKALVIFTLAIFVLCILLL